MIWNLFGAKKISGDGFSVRIGRQGRLIYEEGANKFLVNAIEGGGYGIVVEEMADADVGLLSKSTEQRLRIALNIKHALEAKHIVVDVYQDNRVVVG